MSVFICWHDYNGHHINKYPLVRDAEVRCLELLKAKDKDNSSNIHIDLIVEGIEYGIKMIEIPTIRLEKKL